MSLRRGLRVVPVGSGPAQGHPLEGALGRWLMRSAQLPWPSGKGPSAAVSAPGHLRSACAAWEPEPVINSDLGHCRTGHYQEQLSLGPINGPDFSFQTLLLIRSRRHSASRASPKALHWEWHS